MRYLGQDETTQLMGVGTPGEVRAGPDGNLYQWVQTVDGLGNPVGFWRRFRRFIRRALPIVRRFAPFIPGVGPAVAAGLRVATPYLRRAGVAGYDGLGALYQAPDGTVYQVQGLAEEEELRGLAKGEGLRGFAEDEELRGFAEDEELRGFAEDELTQQMGIGAPSEVRAGPDGNLYQWVQTVDGLGNPVGFWRALRRIRRRVRRFVRAALPIVQRVASAIPLPQAQAVAAGLRVATPFLRQAGVAGHDGVGALYQAPDGTLYQAQGLAEDEELRGLAEEEDLRGYGEDEELRGFGEDEELRGYGEEEDLRGFAEEEQLRGYSEDDELRGYGEDEELRGLDQGYVREPGGLAAYVPVTPPRTRWWVAPAQPPEMWKPLW